MLSYDDDDDDLEIVVIGKEKRKENLCLEVNSQIFSRLDHLTELG